MIKNTNNSIIFYFDKSWIGAPRSGFLYKLYKRRTHILEWGTSFAGAANRPRFKVSINDHHHIVFARR